MVHGTLSVAHSIPVLQEDASSSGMALPKTATSQAEVTGDRIRWEGWGTEESALSPIHIAVQGLG